MTGPGSLRAVPAADPESRLGTLAGRLSTVPLWAHALLLGLVLVGLVPILGAEGRFMSDEGAALAQVDQVTREGTWFVPNPFVEVDPDGAWFVFEKAAWNGEGGAPLGKKAAYPIVLAGPYALAGTTGAVLVSVAGAVLASVTAAALARRFDPRFGAAALWLAGLLTPLLFDATLVLGHTLGAALAGGATLLLLPPPGEPPRAGPWRLAAGLVGLVALVLLRNEGLFFAGGLAVALGLIGWEQRRGGSSTATAPSGVALLIPLGCVGAAVLGYGLDRVADRRVLGVTGSYVPASGSDRSGGGVGSLATDRIDAAMTTLLRPGYVSSTGGLVLLGVLVVGLVVAVVARRGGSAQVLKVASVILAGLSALRLVLPRPGLDVVPGLLVAAPVLPWGIALARRDTVARPPGRDLLVVAGVFGAAVLATQYRTGGAWEWGGRFFGLALPLLAAVAVAGLVDAGDRRGGERRWLVGSMLVAAGLVAVSGLGAQARTQDANAELEAVVAQFAAGTRAGDGGRPVVIGTEPDLLRSAWRSTDALRILRVEDPAELGEALSRLEDVGITEVTIVTQAGPAVRAELERTGAEVERTRGDEVDGAWWVATSTLRSSSG